MTRRAGHPAATRADATAGSTGVRRREHARRRAGRHADLHATYPARQRPPPAQLCPPSLPSNPLLQPSFSPPPAMPPGAPRTLPGNVPIMHARRSTAITRRTDSAVRQVGRYLIQSRLGRGGMASGVPAHDPEHRPRRGDQVPACLAARRRGVPRALPARGTRRRRAVPPEHRTVHDVGEIEGRPYMAMELLEGSTLADVIERGQAAAAPRRRGDRHANWRARSTTRTRAASSTATSSPRNIMLRAETARSRSPTSASRASTDVSRAAHAGSAIVLGTPQYMSPEQTRGDKLDGRSDLFSAGHRAVPDARRRSGRSSGDSLVALATKIANEEPPPLDASCAPTCPASLRRVVERCLAKAPEQRFQSGPRAGRCTDRRCWSTSTRRRAEHGQAAHHAAAREMGADDGADRRGGDGASPATVITQRQHAAMMDQVYRLRCIAGPFHRARRTRSRRWATSGQRSKSRCRR